MQVIVTTLSSLQSWYVASTGEQARSVLYWPVYLVAGDFKHASALNIDSGSCDLRVGQIKVQRATL